MTVPKKSLIKKLVYSLSKPASLILKPADDSRDWRLLHSLPFAAKHFFVAKSNFIVNMDSSFTCLERHRFYNRCISQTRNRKYVPLWQQQISMLKIATQNILSCSSHSLRSATA